MTDQRHPVIDRGAAAHHPPSPHAPPRTSWGMRGRVPPVMGAKLLLELTEQDIRPAACRERTVVRAGLDEADPGHGALDQQASAGRAARTGSHDDDIKALISCVHEILSSAAPAQWPLSGPLEAAQSRLP